MLVDIRIKISMDQIENQRFVRLIIELMRKFDENSMCIRKYL